MNYTLEHTNFLIKGTLLNDSILRCLFSDILSTGTCR